MQIKITPVVICPSVTCTKQAWPKHINISQLFKNFQGVTLLSYYNRHTYTYITHFYYTHLYIFLFPTSHHCRSYIPNPYGGHTACKCCSPGWVGRHTLYSTCNYQTPNSRQRGTLGAWRGIHTQLGSWLRSGSWDQIIDGLWIEVTVRKLVTEWKLRMEEENLNYVNVNQSFWKDLNETVLTSTKSTSSIVHSFQQALCNQQFRWFANMEQKTMVDGAGNFI